MATDSHRQIKLTLVADFPSQPRYVNHLSQHSFLGPSCSLYHWRAASPAGEPSLVCSCPAALQTDCSLQVRWLWGRRRKTERGSPSRCGGQYHPEYPLTGDIDIQLSYASKLITPWQEISENVLHIMSCNIKISHRKSFWKAFSPGRMNA